MEACNLINDINSLLHSKILITLINVIIFVILIIISNWVIDKLVLKLTKNQDLEFKKQLVTLTSIIKSIADTVIIILASMFILNYLGIDIRPILTAAGVLGVAVGFGAKRFFEDIITGFCLLLEGQIRVGDYVEIAGHEGIIEKADIKMVRLRDLKGRVHYIRNGMIDIVTNYTRDFSYYLFDIGVSYKENIAEVMQVIKDLSEDLRINSEYGEDILEPLEMLGLDKFEDSAIIIRARIKTKPVKQWEVGRALNLKIKEKFDELKIEMPFPQTSVHIEKD